MPVSLQSTISYGLHNTVYSGTDCKVRLLLCYGWWDYSWLTQCNALKSNGHKPELRFWYLHMYLDGRKMACWLMKICYMLYFKAKEYVLGYSTFSFIFVLSKVCKVMVNQDYESCVQCRRTQELIWSRWIFPAAFRTETASKYPQVWGWVEVYICMSINI